MYNQRQPNVQQNFTNGLPNGYQNPQYPQQQMQGPPGFAPQQYGAQVQAPSTRAPKDKSLNPLIIHLSTSSIQYSYKSFQIHKLQFGAPEPKDPPKDKPQVGSYFMVPIRYNYGTDEVPNFQAFYLEGPMEHIPYGISVNVDKETKEESYSVGSMFDKSNPDHVDYMNVLQQIYQKFCEYVVSVSDKVGMNFFGFNAETDFSIFNPLKPCPNTKPTYTYKKDKATKRPIPSSAPRTYSKVVPYGEYRAMFTDWSNPPKEIERSVIDASELFGFCLRDMSSVFIGGQGPSASIQDKFKSMVIDHLVPRGRNHLQGERVRQMQEAGASKADELNSQISDIMRRLEESKSLAKKIQEGDPLAVGSTESSGATNAGLMPTGPAPTSQWSGAPPTAPPSSVRPPIEQMNSSMGSLPMPNASLGFAPSAPMTPANGGFQSVDLNAGRSGLQVPRDDLSISNMVNGAAAGSQNFTMTHFTPEQVAMFQQMQTGQTPGGGIPQFHNA